jgi:L-lactate utilization protein LutB
LPDASKGIDRDTIRRSFIKPQRIIAQIVKPQETANDSQGDQDLDISAVDNGRSDIFNIDIPK